MGEPCKTELRFRNIAAYWRARATKLQNPEARIRLNATAAHYEKLARGAQSNKENICSSFIYASRQRVLLITARPVVDETIYLEAYDTTVRFVEARGPCSMILDLSAVANFGISPKFATIVGMRKSAVPPGMSRFVVAPQDNVYEICSRVEHLRSSTAAPINLVRHIDQAFAHFGVTRSDFAEVFEATQS